MNLKKYTAATEQEAMLLVKQDLGNDAIVMNIKKISPRGIHRLFKQPKVEITAAIDDTKPEVKKPARVYQAEKSPKFSVSEEALRRGDVLLDEKQEKSFSNASEATAIEQKLNQLEELLHSQINIAAAQEREKEEIERVQATQKENPYVSLVSKQLTKNEVTEENAMQIISEVEGTFKKDAAIDNILAGVYQKIVLKLGTPKTIQLDQERAKTKFVFFIGPTGVGKTTTIAKIASTMKLNEQANVGLVTFDTYRVAAVEQLRTYANILGIPLTVAYSYKDMEVIKEKYSDYDLVLVDTAGRSHKNKEQCYDIKNVINSIDDDQKDIYLVLSATTKYKDLVRIIDTYKEIANFSVIFTKLDETTCLGNILNIKMLTNAPLSYTTSGQNVPDDINVLNTQEIAKQLLGGNE
ncbi:flagellar biosynthesis protein FlhF [Lachnospiraceae bacterium KM106-2]|nr:flagellar biosynthesis protein FlhF [Lachnospiraceae bacterium KM106-2]